MEKKQLIIQKTLLATERGAMQELAHREIREVEPKYNQQKAVGKQIQDLEKEREKINDNFKYGKHLAKFPGATVTELKALDNALSTDEEASVTLFGLYIDQNDKVKEGEKFKYREEDTVWDNALSGITATLK